jgi:hypothetical protein
MPVSWRWAKNGGNTPMPEGKKTRRQTEALLCSQFVAENYPTARTYIQQYLGPFAPIANADGRTREEALATNTGRRRADAVLIYDDKIILLECYIHVQLGKLSQLLTYLQLLPLTPEIAQFAHLPVTAKLVGAQRDPILDQMAAKFGIEVVIFRPKWAVDYLATVAARHSRERNNVDLRLNERP